MVRVANAGKLSSGTLPVTGDHQQISILAEEHASTFRRSLEQVVVFPVCRAILEGRQHFNSAGSQSVRNGPVDVVIHVQRNAHGNFPVALSLRRTGDSPAPALR